MASRILFDPPPPVNAMELVLSFVRDGTLVFDADGRLWRHKVGGRPAEPRRVEHTDSKGYLRVTVGIPRAEKTCHVQAHCLLWTLLHGPIPAGMQVNHKNLDKKDNRPDNLELVTGSGNIRHSYANGRPRPWHKATLWQGRPRVTAERKEEIRRARAEGLLYREIAARFGLSLTHVQRIARADKKGGER
jgi:hypothetical protein